MYSVMIHHAVSGCFTCRKIICFNLPSLQIHAEHHILCKAVLWVAALSSPLQQALLCASDIFLFPSKSQPGIPFQNNALKVSISKERLLPVPFSSGALPPCTAFHHAAGDILQCRKAAAWCSLVPSLLAEGLDKFTLGGAWIFYSCVLYSLNSFSIGHRACAVGKTGSFCRIRGGLHHGTKCAFCKPVFLTTLYAKRRGCRDGEESLGLVTDYFPLGALSLLQQEAGEQMPACSQHSGTDRMWRSRHSTVGVKDITACYTWRGSGPNPCCFFLLSHLNLAYF